MHKNYCLFDVGQAALSRQPCERLIVSPRRQILIEGPLLLVDTGKPSDMHVILFDDLLLITRKKKALSKKVRAKVSLKELDKYRLRYLETLPRDYLKIS